MAEAFQKQPRDVLSLDLGTSTGWAFAREGVIMKSGILDMSKSNELRGQKYIRFHNWLSGFSGVDAVYFEDVKHHQAQKSIMAIRNYCGFLAVLEMFAYGAKIPLIGMAIGTIKMIVGGHGHCSKEDVCRALHQLGWQNGEPGTMIDNDEADACAIILATFSKMGYSGRFDGSDLDFETFDKQRG